MRLATGAPATNREPIPRKAAREPYRLPRASGTAATTYAWLVVAGTARKGDPRAASVAGEGRMGTRRRYQM